MTHDEFQVLADLLGIEGPLAAAAHRVHVDQDKTVFEEYEDVNGLHELVERIAQAERRVRRTFVIHQPSCWQVVVGHHDHHRAPGKIKLKVGEKVRLVCSRVNVMVAVTVTDEPPSPHGYYKGVVHDLPATAMRYRRGDGVLFADDQAVLPSTVRKPRRPIPF